MPVVKDGDCMVSLADSLGMNDYHTLYDDGVNAALKGTRHNPNQLVVGDDVKLPPAKGKVHGKAVDQTWTFVIRAKKPTKLRVAIVDAKDKPLAGKPWASSAPKALAGKTKSDGLIEITDFPPQETAAAFELTWRETKSPKPLKPEKDKTFKVPTYPRPIKASEFKDDAPKAPDAADDKISFTLKVGSLPDFDSDRGVRARLHNLGHACEPDSDATVTSKVVKAFQRVRLAQKTPSGVAADIRASARDKHDR
jgi:hypothetical protein